MRASDLAAIFRFIAGVKRTRQERKTIGVPLAWVLHSGVNLSLIFISIALFAHLVLVVRLGAPPLGLDPLRFEDIPSRLAVLDTNALLALGILILLATPLARVMASVVLYLRQRDLVFSIITLVVLANLSLGLLLGTIR
jgi:uncharacterized membrane protein